jgi:four helix bundle protein
MMMVGVSGPDILFGMQNTQNLVVATFARKLVAQTYRTTERFPRSEIFGLTSQMRRAAISIGSNIAEGCGRSSKKQLIHACNQAMGEASELEYQCLVALDLEYGRPNEVEALRGETERVKRMLSRLIVALRNQGPKPKTKESPATRSSPVLDRRTDKPTDEPTD